MLTTLQRIASFHQHLWTDADALNACYGELQSSFSAGACVLGIMKLLSTKPPRALVQRDCDVYVPYAEASSLGLPGGIDRYVL